MAYKEIDVLLENVLEQLMIEEYEKIQDHIELYGKHTFSENFEKWISAIFDNKSGSLKTKAFKRQEQESESIVFTNEEKRRKLIPMRFWLIAILIAVLFSISTAAGKGLMGYYQQIRYETDKDAIVFFPSDDVNSGESENYSVKLYAPTYATEGYEIIEQEYNDIFSSVFVLWINDTETVLYYKQHKISAGEMLITSDGTEPVDIKIGNHDGITFSDEGGCRTVLYKDGNHTFSVSGFEEIDELIKVLLSIQPVDEEGNFVTSSEE